MEKWLDIFYPDCQYQRMLINGSSFLEITFKHFDVNIQDIIKVKIASVVPEIERELYELFINVYILRWHKPESIIEFVIMLTLSENRDDGIKK